MGTEAATQNCGANLTPVKYDGTWAMEHSVHAGCFDFPVYLSRTEKRLQGAGSSFKLNLGILGAQIQACQSTSCVTLH
jgi:hypothetical protein